MHLADRLRTKTLRILHRRRLARTQLGRLLLEHRDEVIRTAEDYGLGGLYVFGSVARGTTRPNSDIDLVATQVAPSVSLFELGGVVVSLQELLNVEVDIGLYRAMKPDVKEETRKDMVPL